VLARMAPAAVESANHADLVIAAQPAAPPPPRL
jgi:hypothetical protein